jgi:hypothetical protein
MWTRYLLLHLGNSETGPAPRKPFRKLLVWFKPDSRPHGSDRGDRHRGRGGATRKHILAYFHDRAAPALTGQGQAEIATGNSRIEPTL